MSIIFYPFLSSLAQSAAQERSLAATLHVWVVVLLLLCVSSVKGTFLENSANAGRQEMSGGSSVSVGGNLFISISLNGTKYFSKGDMANNFASALLLDLCDIFSSSFQLSDVFLCRKQVTSNLPLCSLRETSGQPSLVRSIVCNWRPNDKKLFNVSFHPQCLDRLHAISQPPFPNHRALFARTSAAYRALSGDSLPLVPVAGACAVPGGGGSPTRAACGAVSCLLLAALLAGCCVLALAAAALVWFLTARRRRGPRAGAPTAEAAGAAEAEAAQPLVLNGAAAAECRGHRGSAARPGARLRAAPVRTGTRRHGHAEHRQSAAAARTPPELFVQAEVRPEEGIPIDIEEYATMWNGNAGQAAFFHASSNGSCAGQMGWRSAVRQENSPRLLRPIDIMSESRGTAGSPKGLASVKLSAEEREQLQRQETWLGAHVVGLDSL